MPTIWKITPDFSGHFSTLQAWENFADDQATADQWAECYSGGDLGTCVLAGWSSTPTAMIFPRIYAAPWHRHNTDVNAGAFIDQTSGNFSIRSQIDFLRVEGLRIDYASTGTSCLSLLSATGCLFDGNLIVASIAGAARGIHVSRQTDGPNELTVSISNNIITVADFDEHAIVNGIDLTISDLGDGQSVTANIINNTLEIGSQASDAASGILWRTAGSPHPGGALNLTLLNNAIGECGEGLGLRDSTSTIALNYDVRHNATKDATAAGFGGSGNLTGQDRAAMWSNPDAHNYVPLRGGPLVDAGADVASFGVTTDLRGVPRAAGAATDIGALELFPALRRYSRLAAQRPFSRIRV